MARNSKASLLFVFIGFFALYFPLIARAEYYCSITGSSGFYFADPPQKTTFTFIVKPGVPCPQRFGSASTSTFKDIIYQESAKHGTVTLRQSGSVYTAKSDYHGKDSFTLRLCGNGKSIAYGCADLVYSVTVE